VRRAVIASISVRAVIGRLGFAWIVALATASCGGDREEVAGSLAPRSDDLLAAAAPAEPAPRAPSGTGGLRSSAEPVTRLPERAGQGFALADPVSAVSIAVHLEGANDVAVERAGESLLFRGALPGVDHRIDPRRGGLEDKLLFVAPPARAAVTYRLALGAAVAGLRLVGGVLEVLDAGGAPRLRVRAPALHDSAGHERALRLVVEGCAVDTSPRLPWRRAPVAPGAASCALEVRWDDAGLRYPVVVDPIWELTGEMAEQRERHAAALLPGNRVLVAGGNNDAGDVLTASAEVYDLDTQTWAATDSLATARRSAPSIPLPVSAALPEGGALVIGGRAETAVDVTAGCEIYDLAAGTWSAAGNLITARSHHVAVMLADGTVLVAGGENDTIDLASAERSSADFSAWSALPDMPNEHFGASAAIVDGQVMVAGGLANETDAHPLSDLFDPVTETWSPGPQMAASRAFYPMAKLSDGRLLAVGGMTAFIGFGAVDATAAVDLYDPVAGTWSPTDPLPLPRFNNTATELKNGLVLLHGGRRGGLDETMDVIYDTTLLWDPATGQWTAGGAGATFRQLHSATRFDGGEVLVAGGDKGGNLLTAVLDSSELWTLTADGEACADFKECTSGHCIEGICCDAACDGVCESCLATRTGGSDGTCAPVSEGTDPDNECLDSGAGSCADNGLCDGAGACQEYGQPQGCDPAPCTAGEECLSGFCADGICCAGPCEGECRSCLGSANGVEDGQCLPIAAGTDPENECADDGTTSCASILLCDGNGACVTSNAVCAPYTCLDAEGCKESCLVDADCLPTHRCDDGACVLREPSCDGEVFVDADGNRDDCAPYSCDPASPSCKTSCQSAADCAPGFVCDGAGQCVAAPSAAASDGDDGCGCRTAGAPSSGALPGFAALALALAAARRRRRVVGASR
jgi:MYXO-CTERM domain-containing protein